MQILNIGPLELLLFIVLILVVLGPEDMVKTARGIGKFIYRITHSPIWKDIMETTQEIRELPKKIVEETGLQETVSDITQTTKQVAQELSQSTSEIQQGSEVKVEASGMQLPAQQDQPMPAVNIGIATDLGGTEVNNIETTAQSPTEILEQAEDLPQKDSTAITQSSQLEAPLEAVDPLSVIPTTDLPSVPVGVSEIELAVQTNFNSVIVDAIPEESVLAEANQPTQEVIDIGLLPTDGNNNSRFVEPEIITIDNNYPEQVKEVSEENEKPSNSSDTDPLVKNV